MGGSHAPEGRRLTAAVLEAGGVEVHVEGEGADTIVMVHGWPDSWRLWDAQVAALSPRWRCARFSLPGYEPGATPRLYTLDELVATIAAVVDAVSPGRPVTLLLHDWGCVFGYAYAERHRERVNRIVGIDVGDAGSREHVKSLSLVEKAGVAAYQWWLAAAWKRKGAGGDRMTRHMAARLRAPKPHAAIGWRMNYPYVLAWTGGLKRAIPPVPHCPLLYFWGERKPAMFHSPEWLARIAAAPGSAVQALPTGHWVMVKGAEALNARIAQWLVS